MRGFILMVIVMMGQLVFASPPPPNYPIVNGLVKKIDIGVGQITLKHEAIPNLNMPGMTMPFQADPQLLQGFAVGDKVQFVADENANGDLAILWIQKEPAGPPENYPLVNGLVRKIDAANKQITLKHEAIPNLNMPAMTMPFVVSDLQMIQGLSVGDNVKFAADEDANGDLKIIWIAKAQQPVPEDKSALFCTGVGNTTPKTNVEIEIRKEKFSTIRYEYAEGSLKGTAYINSIGRMILTQEGDLYRYQAGDGKLDSKLILNMKDNQIQSARFYNFSASMNFDPVQCRFETNGTHQ